MKSNTQHNAHLKKQPQVSFADKILKPDSFIYDQRNHTMSSSWQTLTLIQPS